MRKKIVPKCDFLFYFIYIYIFFFFWGGGRLEIHVLVGDSGVSMPANQYDLIVFVTIFVIKKCGKS